MCLLQDECAVAVPEYRPFEEAFLAARRLLSLSAGGLIAEWAAQDRVKSLENLFSGFAPTYALELAKAGHESITLETPADDAHYLELIELEKRWLKANPIIADVYTFRKDREGRLRFIVDSETDYDHSWQIRRGT